MTAQRRRCSTRRAIAGSFAVLFLAGAPMTGRADAVGSISEPSGNPYHVPLDAQGRPVPFTIAVAGYTAGSLVYVEQCDAQPTSATNWAPTRNCDIGTSPAAAIVDPSGHARFDATDRNHSFQPFVGLGPEGLFNCLTPDAASLKNGLPEYRTCQVRVSSNNNQSTADQVMLSIVFEGAARAATSGSSSSSSAPLLVVVVVAVLAVAGGGLAFGLRRRRASHSA